MGSVDLVRISKVDEKSPKHFYTGNQHEVAYMCKNTIIDAFCHSYTISNHSHKNATEMSNQGCMAQG